MKIVTGVPMRSKALNMPDVSATERDCKQTPKSADTIGLAINLTNLGWHPRMKHTDAAPVIMPAASQIINVTMD